MRKQRRVRYFSRLVTGHQLETVSSFVNGCIDSIVAEHGENVSDTYVNVKIEHIPSENRYLVLVDVTTYTKEENNEQL